MRHLPFLILGLAAALLFESGPAIAAPVQLDWDEWGVAHVSADSLKDGGYGLGWAQMEQRGETVATGYLVARGEAASCLGEAMVASDTRIRQLGVPERAAAWLTEQDAETRALLSGFAAGMNAWLKAHPGRTGALACLGRVTEADPLGLLQVTLHVAVVAFGSEAQIGQWRETRGSNAYAFGPSKTADGRTLLLINPHSGWSPPYLVYETHLMTPGLNIYGMTFPGLPLPFAGFTQEHGWGLTFNDIDGVDYYGLDLKGDSYRFGERLEPLLRREVSLKVRTATGALESRDLVLEQSIHGPVVARDGERGLAVRMAGLDRPHLLRQLLAMWRARDLSEFKVAVAQQQIPITNIVYANASGDVFYLFNGLSPKRSKGDRAFWSGVVDGADPELVWTDYLPFDALPQTTNPSGGFVQNANDGPTTSSWPPAIRMESAEPTLTDDPRTPRGRRSLRQAAQSKALTLEGLGALRASSVADVAEQWKGPLAEAAGRSADPAVRRLGAVLAGWDGSARPDSRGGVLFAEWAYRMRRAGLDPASVGGTGMTPVVAPLPPQALDHLKASGAQIDKLFGASDVAWGEVYRIRKGGLDLPSPVGRDELGAFNAGRYRRISEPGPDLGRFVLTDASHFIAEVAFGPEGPEARGLLTYGNLDDERDPSVQKQLRLFSQSQVRSLLFRPGQVQAGSVRSETLTPE
jgi:acyl-homoserine-lactone acylase